MTDVTTRVLDELNTIPGTPVRPGLSRMDSARPFIHSFAERYAPDELSMVQGMNNDELWDYLQNQDTRMLHFEFDTQNKDIQFTSIDDDSINEQALSLTAATPQPAFETVILEREGDVVPKLIAVSIPSSIDLSSFAEGGLPFHVYFHPTVAQNMEENYNATAMPGRESLKDTIDGKFSPYGWDYLFFIIVRNLTYQTDTNLLDNGLIDEWCGKGLLYQMANAGKDIINVIPVLDPAKNAGDFEHPDSLLQILMEVQQWILDRQAAGDGSLLPVGRVAVSAFSSGHLCCNNLMQSYNNDAFSNFYGDTLQELYMFDAPSQTNDQWVKLATGWANKYGEDKVVRAYSQWLPTNVHALLANGQQVEGGKVVLNSDNSNRSFAWVAQPFFSNYLSSAGWQEIHQAIPALMLNDALGRSQF